MKIVHTLMSISRKAGGLQGAVLSLCRALSESGNATIDVIGLADEFSTADKPMWSPTQPKSFRSVGPRAFGYAPEMLPEMLAVAPDVIHCHGLWLYPGVATLTWHSRTGRPYVISPHGMLERQVEMKKSRLKKAAALWLYQSRHLRRAACIHALCEAEVDDIRQMGLRNPVCVIPNGVSPPLPKFDVPPPWDASVAGRQNVLLYLGRVAKKKGLVELLQALSILRKRDRQMSEAWRVVVVGWEKENHQAELQELANSLQLNDLVKFVGPLFGDDKDAAYRNANAFVLPSKSEGLPLVIPEAWSYGLPVVMTPPCNIPEGPAAGAALLAEPAPESLADALGNLFRMSDEQRREMGARGRELSMRKFAWPNIAAQMKAVYEWLSAGGTPPETVRTT